jgi:hypothetical protein
MRMTEVESGFVVGETVRFVYNGKIRQGTIETISEYTAKRTAGKYSDEHGYIKLNDGQTVKTFDLRKIDDMEVLTTY